MAAVVLDEHIDENYEPTEKEISEYATWLGIEHEELLWLAKEGLKAPLPAKWKPCQTTDDDEIFYFNFETGESVWDHPCDEHYRRLISIERKKINGEILSEDDRSYLRKTGRKDLLQPPKIGTIAATLNAQGVVEVSASSMGGNSFAFTTLESADGYEPFRSVQKRMLQECQEKAEIQFVLPDGTMLGKEHSKKPLRDLILLSNAGAWPEKIPKSKPTARPTSEKHFTRKERSRKEIRAETGGEATCKMESGGLPPLKITKKLGFRALGTSAGAAAQWTVPGEFLDKKSLVLNSPIATLQQIPAVEPTSAAPASPRGAQDPFSSRSQTCGGRFSGQRQAL